MKFNSICVKELRDKQGVRSHILPIYSTSSFSFDNVEQCTSVFEGKEKGYTYGRYGNPTVDAVANKIAELEAYGLDIQAKVTMTGSGMSAISTLFIAALKISSTKKNSEKTSCGNDLLSRHSSINNLKQHLQAII